MNLTQILQTLSDEKNIKITQADLSRALNVTRQTINKRIKTNSNVSIDEFNKLKDYFHISFTKSKTGEVENIKVNGGNTDPCVDIPVRGDVFASMGCGVSVYDETQTGVYRVSRKFVSDLGTSTKSLEMIFAQGNSMSPTIESGDSLIIDKSKKEVYDGKIYCVRIDGQLFAKRLQKLPPHSVNVVSDNSQYENFKIDFSQKIDFDFEVIGEVRWCGRVLR